MIYTSFMARSIDEVNITNFVNTGLTTQLPRYTFTLHIKYTDNTGAKQTYGPTTQTYPNDLTAMPLNVRRKFAEKMITATVRVALGLDDWEAYS